MKLTRIIILALALILMLSSVATAHQYYGHYSVYYGSAYRPFYNYHHYGPAVYQYRPYYVMEWSAPRLHHYRYTSANNYYYYADPYYNNYRYERINNNRYWWGW
jgi:hypothetical protein